ncbi:MAG: RidA family protein, partial [Synechococcales cyanobacterium CRU_2_2]|nr:RidA family protein [Synechococcales cyanobacterium CRU_2_2]
LESVVNLLASVREALGSLDRVKRVVKVLGMVNATETFGEHSKVMNGFSDLMVEVFGDAGRHARRRQVGPGARPALVRLSRRFVRHLRRARVRMRVPCAGAAGMTALQRVLKRLRDV